MLSSSRPPSLLTDQCHFDVGLVGEATQKVTTGDKVRAGKAEADEEVAKEDLTDGTDDDDDDDDGEDRQSEAATGAQKAIPRPKRPASCGKLRGDGQQRIGVV